MKLIRSHQGQYWFSLDPEEKDLFFDLLQRYPMIPPSHHQLSRTADPEAIREDQELLDDALAKHKRQNRRELAALLSGSENLVRKGKHFVLRMDSERMQWLLQVLNDIRVGSWLKLGSPAGSQLKDLAFDAAALPHFVAMEFCGLMQHYLLGIVNRQG